MMRVLLVETDPYLKAALEQLVSPLAIVDGCANFSDARDLIFECRYHRLVTNLRVGIHNGLHLVHLAHATTRSVVYTKEFEVFWQGEVQRLGAFYETADRLHWALASYVCGALPTLDRRRTPHGLDDGSCAGRRASDVMRQTCTI